MLQSINNNFNFVVNMGYKSKMIADIIKTDYGLE